MITLMNDPTPKGWTGMPVRTTTLVSVSLSGLWAEQLVFQSKAARDGSKSLGSKSQLFVGETPRRLCF